MTLCVSSFPDELRVVGFEHREVETKDAAVVCARSGSSARVSSMAVTMAAGRRTSARLTEPVKAGETTSYHAFVARRPVPAQCHRLGRSE